MISRLPDGVFAAQTRLQTLLLGSNILSELTFGVFGPLGGLTTLSVEKNNISRIEQMVFGSLLFSNLSLDGSVPQLLDMTDNPSVCQVAWMMATRASVVACECRSGMLGTSMAGQLFTSGCDDYSALGLAHLPSVLRGDGSVLVHTRLTAKNVTSLFCNSSATAPSASGNSNSSAGVPGIVRNNTGINVTTPAGPCCQATQVDDNDISLTAIGGSATASSQCELVPGFMAQVIPCNNMVFDSAANYFLALDFPSFNPLSTSKKAVAFTLRQADVFQAVKAPLYANPLYASTIAFDVVPGLPAGLLLDAASGNVYGSPEHVQPTALYQIRQLTSVGNSAPCINVVALLNLTIISCDKRTCNGGVCEEVSTFSETITCRCPASAIGRFCEIANPFAPMNESGYMAMAFLLSLLVAVLVTGMDVFWQRKRYHDSRLHDLETRLLHKDDEMREMQSAWRIYESELRILGVVGQGGFGLVQKARWRDMTVAVKRVKAGLLELDDLAADGFQREVAFMQKIRHEHIVLFFGAGVFSDGTPFLVTELMKRGSLRKVLDETATISLQRKIQFALDAALGMQHLHSLNRIHCDLKADNLLVASNFRLKVTDFGTAGLLNMSRHTLPQTRNIHAAAAAQPGPLHGSGESPFSSGGGGGGGEESSKRMLWSQAVGTPEWMAPELVQLQQRPADEKKLDIYSYGVVLYEILTHRWPWAELPNRFGVTEAVLSGRRPTVPIEFTGPKEAAFRDLMARCWAQEPAARPSFDEILADHIFDRLLRGPASHAGLHGVNAGGGGGSSSYDDAHAAAEAMALADEDSTDPNPANPNAYANTLFASPSFSGGAAAARQ